MLLNAVESLDHISIQQAIDNNEDPDFVDPIDGDTVLSIAVNIGDLESIAILLDAGADPNKRNADGTTSLTWAQDIRAAQQLIDAGARVEQENPEDGMTSLHIAAANGNEALIALLLHSAGGKYFLDGFDSLERTPLACAVEAGHILAARTLLDAGANVNATDEANLGRPPIYWAIDSGNFELTQLLLLHGANPRIKLGLNESPLELAKKRQQDDLLSLVEAYSSHGCSTVAVPEPTVGPDALGEHER